MRKINKWFWWFGVWNVWVAAAQTAVMPADTVPTDSTRMTARPPFIHEEENRLIIPPELDTNFIALMRRLKDSTAKIRIMHFGGSHIQAGVWPYYLRVRFRECAGMRQGERGWIFPYNLAHTNNPRDYRIESDAEWKGYRSSWQRAGTIPYAYGLSGYVIVTGDSTAAMRLHMKDTLPTDRFTRLRILHNKGKMPYRLEVIKPGPEKIRIRHITDGITELIWDRPHREFEVRWNRKAGALSSDSLEIYGFILDNEAPGISYSGIGVNGAGTYTYLEAENFEKDLALYPPDLAIISLGTNDANIPVRKFKPEVFRQRLEAFIKRLKKVNPSMAVILTVPNDAYYRRRYPNPNVAAVRKVILDTGRRYGFPVWDLYAVMGGKGSSHTWYENGLMKKDRIHFTHEGYRLLADLLFEAVVPYCQKIPPDEP